MWYEYLYGTTDRSTRDPFDPQGSGISSEAIAALAEQLQRFWQRYGGRF